MTTSGPPGDEATEDALDELGRMDMGSAAPFDPLDEASDIPPIAGAAASAEELRVATGEARTIEDLYAEHPDIGQGSKLLRVIRKLPTSWGGVRISGWLQDLHEQVTTEEFASRFGGGTYEVLVLGAVRGSLAEDGSPRLRTLRTLRIEFSGAPKAMGTSTGSPEAVPSAMYGGSMQHPQGIALVEVERVRNERAERDRAERERGRLIEEARNAGKLAPGLVQQMEQMAQRRVEESRQSWAETAAQQRSTIARLEQRCEQLEAKVTAERDKSLELQRRWAERQQEEESRTITELRARHEAELASLRTDKERQLDQARSELDRRLAASESEHKEGMKVLLERRDEERKNATESALSERTRMREEFDRRERQLVTDAEQRERSLRQSFEDRFNDLTRSQARELESLRTSFTQNIESIRTTESSKADSAQRSASIEAKVLKDQIDSLKMQLAAREQEANELRAKTNKSFSESLEEVRAHASMIGLEPPGAGEPAAADWKSVVGGIFKGAVEKLPDIMKSMEQARAQNQNQHRQPPPGYVRQGAPPGLPPVGMPPQGGQMQPVQQPPQRRQWRAPAMPGFGANPFAPPDGSANPYAPPEGGVPIAQPLPAMRPPVPIGSRGPETREAAVPRAGDAPAPDGTFEPFEQTQPPAQPAPQAAPAPPVASAQAPQGALRPPSEAEVAQLVESLEMAISTHAVEPREFAEKLLSQMDRGVARQIVTNVSPDMLVDGIAQSKGGPLATHEGRKYVHALWEEAQKILGQAT